MFTKAYLDRYFVLDYETGFLYRKNGKRVDHFHGKYRRVAFEGAKYYAHHLIWCMAYGDWPCKDIDHRDGNPQNNRPNNLREAGASNNIANADFGPSRGVEKHGRQYRARIVVNGARHELGSFDIYDDAVSAYKTAAEKFFGEFAFHNR